MVVSEKGDHLFSNSRNYKNLLRYIPQSIMQQFLVFFGYRLREFLRHNQNRKIGVLQINLQSFLSKVVRQAIFIRRYLTKEKSFQNCFTTDFYSGSKSYYFHSESGPPGYCPSSPLERAPFYQNSKVSGYS